MVFDHCDPLTLRHLRTVNKRFFELTTPHVSGSIYVGWLPEYSARLKAIAFSSKLEPHVQTLVIEVDLIRSLGRCFQIWQDEMDFRRHSRDPSVSEWKTGPDPERED